MRKGAEKLTKMLITKQQGRLDGFFKVTESASSKAKAAGKTAATGKGAGAKRKVWPFRCCVQHVLTTTLTVGR